MNGDKVAAIWARMDRREAVARAEQVRVERVRAGGFVPDDVGPVPVAPARGPVKSVQRMAMYPDGKAGFVGKPNGHMGRKTLERADVFDRILLASARTQSARPLTPSQIAAGRAYRDLAERYDSAGIKCSSLEGSGGAGTGGSFMDALIQDGEQLALWRRRVGAGVALPVRKVRPSQRGTKKGITDRALVDMVCLGDCEISKVLDAHGWARAARNTKAAMQALAGALDRMAGPLRGGIRVMRVGGTKDKASKKVP